MTYYLKKDDQGCFVYLSLSSTEADSTEDTPEPALDFESITRTVSSIKSWLSSDPSAEAAQQVFDYESANSNRVSAVGEDGCLTQFLKGA